MTKRPPLDDATRARIAEMRESGKSFGQISRALDLSEGQISWHCLVAGIESPRTAGKVLPDHVRHGPYKRNGFTVVPFGPADDDRLLVLEARGLSYGKIAKAMGRKPNSIRGRLAVLARHEARKEAAE